MIAIQDYYVRNSSINRMYNTTKESIQMTSKTVIARTDRIIDEQIKKKIHKTIKK